MRRSPAAPALLLLLLFVSVGIAASPEPCHRFPLSVREIQNCWEGREVPAFCVDSPRAEDFTLSLEAVSRSAATGGPMPVTVAIRYSGECPVIQLQPTGKGVRGTDELTFEVESLDGEADKPRQTSPEYPEIPILNLATCSSLTIFSGDSVSTETLCQLLVLRVARSRPVLLTPEGPHQADWVREGVAAEVLRLLIHSLPLMTTRSRVVSADLRDHADLGEPGLYRVRAHFRFFPEIGFNKLAMENPRSEVVTSEWAEFRILPPEPLQDN
ncbi:MAG: hypothetical protein PWP23_978 [Candidatus Sumerlaeota bacterium]|nr:hypothetical protein [Candidatus Sumerlaeota bacterium]